MTDKEFSALINRTRKAGQKFYGLLFEAEQEYKARFGRDASDVDDVLWIRYVRNCIVLREEDDETFESLMEVAALCADLQPE